MFVLFLLYAVQALKLTEFETFTISLEANASEYFMFEGDVDYIYMSR